ncbi:phosphatidate cytidylyltransferase [Micromonospora radicis]|uniref:Phosphatidate cytidylyltransferase n=1 Tax=Micromonospora radicis TaxID=1894971 RepID=A0A418MZF5_9ACTN|nr:phosphatidate cytidylyltransferase [Micromonospora radicis]RIV40729.1 phosphatidate cytidylyltransferase [Micromonospora radicis]
MSHLDPYGGAEARGWDRPDRSAPLPWPEPQLEPGPWARDAHPGAELHAEPQARLHPPTERPYARHPEGGGYEGGPGEERRDRYDDGWRERFPTGPDRRPGLDHEDAPTTQLEPVRPSLDHEDAPTAQIAPVRTDDEPEHDEQSPGKRHRGRRRAGAGRPPGGKPGRGGRDLPAAISVGVCLGAAVLLPLFLYTPAFLLVLAAAFGVGIWEMSRAVRRAGAVVPLIPLVVGGVLTVTIAWFGGLDALLLGLLVTVAGTLVWRLGDGTANLRRDMTAATLIAVYVPFLGGFAALLASSPEDGALRVLVTLVAVVLSDTGGYAAGANFGKHPMAPTISPKKSWEGLAGSVGAAALGSALLLWLLFDVAPWWGAVFGVAVSAAAILGDLAESMIKRDLGVKDMSNLLPGHGGLMDRLDSVLFAVPTAYLLLVIFVPAVS